MARLLPSPRRMLLLLAFAAACGGADLHADSTPQHVAAMRERRADAASTTVQYTVLLVQGALGGTVTLSVDGNVLLNNVVYGRGLVGRTMLDPAAQHSWRLLSSSGTELDLVQATLSGPVAEWDVVIAAVSLDSSNRVQLQLMRPNRAFVEHSLATNHALLALVNLVASRQYDFALVPTIGGQKRLLVSSLESGVENMFIEELVDDNDLPAAIEVFPAAGFSTQNAVVKSRLYYARLGEITYVLLSGNPSDLTSTPFSVSVVSASSAGTAVQASFSWTLGVVLLFAMACLR